MDSSIVAQISAHSPGSKQVPANPGRRVTVLNDTGINDVSHPVRIDGKELKTYAVWRCMLKRCYSARHQATRPTYVGCSVSAEWLRFSAFEKWMLTQDYERKVLDKDLLFPGNRVYSADTCVFVSSALNGLLTDCRAARGEFPLGVTFNKRSQRYLARVRSEGIQLALGYYSTPLEAHRAWQLAKADIIENSYTEDIRVRIALDKRANKLREDAANGRITETF